MTIQEITDRVSAIRAERRHAEAAHELEDDLHRDFIRWVSSLQEWDPELPTKAALVAHTSEIEFSRWYA